MALETLVVISAALSVVAIAISIMIFVRLAKGEPSHLVAIETKLLDVDARIGRSMREEFARGREETALNAKMLREEVTGSFGGLADAVRKAMADLADGQRTQLDSFAARLGEAKFEAATNAKALREEVHATLSRLSETNSATIAQLVRTQSEKLDSVTAQIRLLAESNDARQETLRKTVEEQLNTLRVENAEKLERMRQTVDEKLQGTLEHRLGASFKLVSDQLEAVHKSVGEMQVLAAGVGDLKKVLTNVRSRGTWGEVSLGNLLEQVMAPDQFDRNVEIRPGTNLRVEFAIRLPGDGEGPIWLPIDAKFPTEDYERLVDATERADLDGIEAASKALELRIRASGKEICDKYIAPPQSTDFAILFLPTEGLFAEVIRRPGLVDTLQRECRIMVAGPTTLVSVLTSLRMGFKTLAIQKRSSEVWRVLAAVKTEFGKFEMVIDKVAKKLQEAQSAVEDVRSRRRVIGRKLHDVEALPEVETVALLGTASNRESLEDVGHPEAAAK